MRGCASPCSISLSTVPMSRYTMRMLWWELLRPFSHLDPLDEQPQQLRRQLVDGGIPMCKSRI